MKKILGAIFLLAVCLQSPFAMANPYDNFHNDCYSNMTDNCNSGCFDSCCELFEGATIEGRFAAFVPFESKVRKIYNDALPSLEVEASMPVWECVSGWVNAGYIWNEGKSLGLENKTELQLIPLSAGLKWVQPVTCDVDLYLGLGATYSFLRIHDHSEFVKEHVRKQAFGGTVKTGFIYHYTCNVFFEGFVDYYYTRFTKSSSHSEPFVQEYDLNMSGLKFGVGAGYSF